MRTLCLILLVHAALQLQCDKRSITAHIGAEFILICRYDTHLFSNKYWCRGESRSTCEVLVDSEGKTRKTHRAHIIDARRRGLVVKVTDLQMDDSGVYWVGIDKMNADIMTSVKVVITEVPVSKPGLRPLSSLMEGPTCRGQPVTVRCVCARGTGVRYAWYQHTREEEVLLHLSADLQLSCGSVEEDGRYHCTVSNAVSSERSELLSVQLLRPALTDCSYVLHMQGQPIYDCSDGVSTTTARTPPPTSCHPDTRNQTLLINHTHQDLFFSRSWTGVPFWYMLLRWASFASLLIFLSVFLKCTKVRRKRAKRKRRAALRRRPRPAR